MRGNALIWMCKKCRWITVSDQYPHRMDYCKCKSTAVDHEVDYTRYSAKDPNDYMFVANVDMDKAEVTSASEHVHKKDVIEAIKYIRGHVPQKIRHSNGKINWGATHTMSELLWAIDMKQKELLCEKPSKRLVEEKDVKSSN